MHAEIVFNGTLNRQYQQREQRPAPPLDTRIAPTASLARGAYLEVSVLHELVKRPMTLTELQRSPHSLSKGGVEAALRRLRVSGQVTQRLVSSRLRPGRKVWEYALARRQG